jgi:hypothetical protein
MSETSMYLKQTTRRHIPEGYYLNTRRRENLKSQETKVYSTDTITTRLIRAKDNSVSEFFSGISFVVSLQKRDQDSPVSSPISHFSPPLPALTVCF